MTTVTLRNLGGSVVIAIPRKILKLINLDAGARVEMSVQEGKLVVEPKRQPRYTLAELLATCTEDTMALTDEDRAWLDASPVGKEAL
jgi:antitoxin component of MazEF toxin-antitoxin module